MRIIPDGIDPVVFTQYGTESAYLTPATIEITDHDLLSICHDFAQEILCNKLDINQIKAMTIRNELLQYIKDLLSLAGVK